MAVACVECNGVIRLDDLDELEAHLIQFHGFLGKDRIRAALAAAGPQKEAAVTAPSADAPPAPARRAKRGRPPGDPAGTPRARRGHPHTKDPEACAHCKRLAPEKCRRHGGPSHSTAFRGKARLGLLASAVRALQATVEEGRRAASQIKGLEQLQAKVAAGARAAAELKRVREVLT